MPEPGDIRVNRMNIASACLQLHLVGHREESAGICSILGRARLSRAGSYRSSGPGVRSEEKLPDGGT